MGCLTGTRVIEFAGIGPGPMCGMLLADLGAEVIVVERPAAQRSLGGGGAMNRGKRSICLDLKQADDLATARQLILSADALIEGLRPGVMERLGLGPESFEASHPGLIYGRVTGWGQTGPLAQAAGHDINYLALTGLLSLSARPGAAPTVPATLLGDMAGGAMFLALGLLAALIERQRSGRGQTIDAAMVDGAGLLGSLVHALRGQGQWDDAPERNFFLHSSPFYDSFECADGRYLSLGAIEPAFYRELLLRLELSDVDPDSQYDSRQWPALRARVAARLKERSRDEWAVMLEGSEACVAPVLSLDEAAKHAHQRARGNFVEVQGQCQPASAPRFSRTPGPPARPAPEPGQDTEAVLAELAALTARGACPHHAEPR
ncbi:CaiB/BaiF CoA-transferase family protein [Paucibacter sp. APW11]|uniref:CaiB/BaiF CoA-transferase family protein n=1 Tax=Roseateles aquae TaxID=3077235 RepID=A0ABU3P9L3_9BURK|nr:CaiB/BaiF CoA-transferase family protein [Paucibacter sp. APW11]MDT8998411.1 CaiB/BaiF CoA-transferase family protein [Paucibacter sp. APW11]